MLSVYHNLEEALVNLTDLSRAERRARLYGLMELTGLGRELLRVPVRQISGGEGRRLSLLRALSVIPDYLVLDEVVSGLDLISADRVLSVLERYKREHACACIFITHDRDSALRIADRALEMREGKITRLWRESARKG
jgi:ABC-type glutathione transport system ATPase component